MTTGLLIGVRKYDNLIEQARKENPLPKTTEKKVVGRKRKNPCPGRTPCELQLIKYIAEPQVFV